TIDKRVIFISESEGSYLDVVATSYRPEVRIVYNKLLKETKNLPDNVVNLADIIDVKGMKAQGNQLTKLKVKEIVLTAEIDGGEPWPDSNIANENQTEGYKNENGVDFEGEEDGSMTIEWDMTDDSKSSEDEDENENENQISLFE